MEKKLNSKSEEFITRFKDNIRTKAIDLKFDEKSKINELLEYVYDYDRLLFSKDDLSKRKRIQNSIPLKIVAMLNAPTTSNAPANVKMDLSFVEPIQKVLHMVWLMMHVVFAPKKLTWLLPILWELFTTSTNSTTCIRRRTF